MPFALLPPSLPFISTDSEAHYRENVVSFPFAFCTCQCRLDTGGHIISYGVKPGETATPRAN